MIINKTYLYVHNLYNSSPKLLIDIRSIKKNCVVKLELQEYFVYRIIFFSSKNFDGTPENRPNRFDSAREHYSH